LGKNHLKQLTELPVVTVHPIQMRSSARRQMACGRMMIANPHKTVQLPFSPFQAKLIRLYWRPAEKNSPNPFHSGASHPMKSIKTKFALAVLTGLLAVPAARVLFAADKPDTPAQTTETAAPNTLTDAEKAAGWKLLFDGKTFDGWHSFKRDNVRPGWKVEDGTLACVDPKNAGDLCTNDKYGWFELSIEYNISHAGNSGILYHVTDAGNATWATGPEFQLEDNVDAVDKIRCGWLYALYQPPIDPTTNKILDATKPVGEWNLVRLLLSPEKCEHDINGVKYFEYILNSDDFKARVAKSKFKNMKNFAKADSGYLALQGDHGKVAFRNIKIRVIDAK